MGYVIGISLAIVVSFFAALCGLIAIVLSTQR